MSDFKPTDLHDEEVVALLALVRLLVIADGEVTVAELAQMNDIGRQVGLQAYAKAALRMEEEPVTRSNTLGLARGVERKDAQKCIISLLDDLASSDGLDESEQDLIDSVRRAWSL